MISISITMLGSLRYRLSEKPFTNYRSQIFSVKSTNSIEAIPNSDLDNWAYSDALLGRILGTQANDGINIAIINAPLERNYYLRRLSNNTVVLSLFEMADIIERSNFSITQFIHRSIYYVIATYYKYDNAIPTYEQNPNVAHEETRGCLFDKTAFKSEIIHSMHKPTLCTECLNMLQRKSIPVDTLKFFKKELNAIRKPLFFRIADWIKRHPLWSLILAAMTSLLINIVSNFVYAWMIKSSSTDKTVAVEINPPKPLSLPPAHR